MINDTSTINEGQRGLVDAPRLLEALFPPASRPSLRWLRTNQRKFPHVRIGRLVFFDVDQVKAHLLKKAAQ
jgi:hypothetical protein